MSLAGDSQLHGSHLGLIAQAFLASDQIQIAHMPGPMLRAVRIDLPEAHIAETVRIEISARLKRSGLARSIAIVGTAAHPARAPDPTLVNAHQRAHRWWQMLAAEPALTIETLAQREEIAPRYLDRILRLRFLSPALTDAIIHGTQPVGLDLARVHASPIPPNWNAQAAALGA